MDINKDLEAVEFILVDSLGNPFDYRGELRCVSYDYTEDLAFTGTITLAKCVAALRKDTRKYGDILGRDLWIGEATAFYPSRVVVLDLDLISSKITRK
jgi:hypothetical protein